MDLRAIKSQTVKLPILHPATNEPTGLVLDVISPQDNLAAAARRTLTDKQQRKKSLTEEDGVEFFAGLVRGWEWTGESAWGGEKLRFTPANVQTVLSEPWVLTQLRDLVEDKAAFFPK